MIGNDDRCANFIAIFQPNILIYKCFSWYKSRWDMRGKTGSWECCKYMSPVSLVFHPIVPCNLRRFRVMHRFAPPIWNWSLIFDYKFFSVKFVVDRPKNILIQCFNRPIPSRPIILRLLIALVLFWSKIWLFISFE